MTDKKMWFGTLYDTKVPGSSSRDSNCRMQWVPAPDTGMGAGASGYSELIEFENGGADVVSSAATHRTYEMNWNLGSGKDLDIIRAYQQGMFGPGLIYFADPMNFATNLFSPHWATPSLSQLGWKSPQAGTPSYPVITYALSETYNLPRRAFTSANGTPADGGSAALADPGSRMAVIPIPPGYTLHVQFRHLTGGGGFIGSRPIFYDGLYGTTTNINMQPIGSGSATTFSGATYRAVEFFVNGPVTGWIDSIAQLWPNSVSPPTSLATVGHMPGAGHTGCKFTTDAIVETYVMQARQLKGMSTTLTEVGAWQRAGT